MENKTALQLAIERIEACQHVVKDTQAKEVFEVAKTLIKAEFETEKQQIVKAYQAGYNHGNIDTCQTSSEYYNSKYGKK